MLGRISRCIQLQHPWSVCGALVEALSSAGHIMLQQMIFYLVSLQPSERRGSQLSKGPPFQL